MTNTPSNHDSDSDTALETNRDSIPGAPRWVKVFGIIAVIVVLLFLILMFSRGPGGGHGPGRHFSSVDSRATTMPSGAAEGHTQTLAISG